MLFSLGEYGTPLEQQEAVWYTGGDVEVAWNSDDCDFYVVAVGDTNISITDENGKDHLVKQPADLMELGIETDSQLQALSDGGRLTWYNNPWFEVYSDTDLDFYSEPIHELDEAIGFAYAQHNERNNPDLNKQEPDIIY